MLFFLKIFLPFRHFDHHFTVFLFTKLFPFEFDSEFRAALLPSVDRLFIWFYWLLLSCSSLYWVCAGFYWVLSGFTEFYWVLPGFTGFYWVLLSFTEFSMVFFWVLLGFPGFYRVLLGFPGFTGFY